MIRLQTYQSQFAEKSLSFITVYVIKLFLWAELRSVLVVFLTTKLILRII